MNATSLPLVIPPLEELERQVQTTYQELVALRRLLRLARAHQRAGEARTAKQSLRAPQGQGAMRG